jgi:hypothetical protein
MSEIFSLVATWEGGGQLFQNVLHYNLEETGTFRPDQYAKRLIDAFIAGHLGPWLDCLSTTVNLASLKSQKISGTGGPTVTMAQDPTDYVGTRDGSIGNTSENVVVEFPVHLNSKNVTGKIFISGIIDDDIVDNVINSTLVDFAQAVGDSMLVPIDLLAGAGNATYVIFNRENGFFATPTFAQIGTVIGSQRRRLRP